jgi:hypothetical protein
MNLQAFVFPRRKKAIFLGFHLLELRKREFDERMRINQFVRYDDRARSFQA